MGGHTNPPDGEPRTSGRWRYLPLGLALLALAGLLASGAHRYLSVDMLAAQRDGVRAFADAHPIQALGLYVAAYVLAVVLSIPASAVLTVVGGFLFGWALGLLAALVGATLGAAGLFLMVRTSLGDILLRRAGPRIQGLAAGFRRNAAAYLLFLRLTPMVPFWMTNIAAALFHVRLSTFLLTTPLGILPVSIAFAVTGAGLDDLLMDQQRERAACLAAGGGECAMSLSLKSLLSPELLAAFAGFGLLALLPIAVKRYYGTRVEGIRVESDGRAGGP
ncbi:TVP38/TMEM64 family protein [Microvirga pudoricolor]|uniref:TVP38/TMEM64 family protein n=1 Tax=Microvirga pudoricolor TaxID=2778729 RepID=UPI00194E9307|nr:VTT domain-containing protein [Microvirga pudoricolor]MBM6596230.1 TVP38/TMEM64 family protein [Microvirga pudoricolor]